MTLQDTHKKLRKEKTAEHPAQLSMYSDCRLRTDMDGQLLLEIHSL